MIRIVCMAPLVLAAACGELVELENTGAACMGQLDGGTAELVADAPATVTAVLDGCASFCASDVRTSCSATLSGRTITVTASGSFRVPDGACESMCERIEAQCDTPDLPAGTYSLEYGGDSVTFDVPGSVKKACTGSIYE